MRNCAEILLLSVPVLTACDGYSSGPDGDGLLSGSYTGEAEIIGVEVVDVTFTLTEYLGGVNGTFTASELTGFYMGSSPCPGPVNASFIVDRP